MGRDRATIVELDARPQQKTISESVGRYLHCARGEAVKRIWFILGAYHQACEGELHALRTIAPEDEGVTVSIVFRAELARGRAREAIGSWPSRTSFGPTEKTRFVIIITSSMQLLS